MKIVSTSLMLLLIMFNVSGQNAADSLKNVFLTSKSVCEKLEAKNKYARITYKENYQNSLKLLKEVIQYDSVCDNCVDTQKGKAYYILCRIHGDTTLQRRIEYADSALYYWSSNKCDEKSIEIMLIKSGYEYNAGDIGNSFETLNEALELTKQYDLKDLEYRVKGTLAVNYMNQNKCEKALLLLDEIENYFSDKKQSNFIFGVILMKASCYATMGNAYKAIPEFLKAEEYAINNNLNRKRLLNIYLNIGGEYFRINEFEKAKDYYKKTINLGFEYNDIDYQAYAFSGLGMLYNKIHKLDSARFYLEKSLKFTNITDDKISFIEILKILGGVYLNEGDLTKAEEYLVKGRDMSVKYQSVASSIECLINLSKLEYKKGNRNKAIILATKAENEALEEGLNGLIKEVSEHLSEIYRLINPEKSREYLAQSYNLKDSLFIIEKHKEISDLEIKYDTEKKEQQIALLEVTTQNQQLSIEKAEQERNMILAGIGLLLFMFVPVGFYARQRSKNKVLEARINSENNECTRIAKELHDGVSGSLTTIRYLLESGITSDKLVENIESVSNEVRGISHKLNMSALASQSFKQAVSDSLMLSHFPNDIDLNINFPEGFEIKAYEKKMNLIRILQELVNNTLKHSEASKIDISFKAERKKIWLTFSDNGLGCKLDEVKKGNGLINIQNRVKVLNGEVWFDSQLNKGFYCQIEI